ncbi:MAG: hypothetical protein OXQ29_27465 [Rhodospirillaceae bacterium]|nr:hypothetical protein [Rhodospirillaceae bacterium]
MRLNTTIRLAVTLATGSLLAAGIASGGNSTPVPAGSTEAASSVVAKELRPPAAQAVASCGDGREESLRVVAAAADHGGPETPEVDIVCRDDSRMSDTNAVRALGLEICGEGNVSTALVRYSQHGELESAGFRCDE